MSKKLSNIKEEIQKVIDDMEIRMQEIGFDKLEGCNIVYDEIAERIKKYAWTPSNIDV